MTAISFADFERVDLRAGTVVRCEGFPEARKPALKVWVDFGAPVGVLQTSAQITVHYTPDSMVGRRVIGCVNLGDKKIAGFTSQFLLVGFSDADGAIRLATTDAAVPDGSKLH